MCAAAFRRVVFFPAVSAVWVCEVLISQSVSQRVLICLGMLVSAVTLVVATNCISGLQVLFLF